MDYTIESHPDDSVTVTVGTITAHVRGESWRDANDAAQALGRLIQAQHDLSALRLRVLGIHRCIEDMDRALAMAAGAMDDLADYASGLSRES